jgi:hypothetical protein
MVFEGENSLLIQERSLLARFESFRSLLDCSSRVDIR